MGFMDDYNYDSLRLYVFYIFIVVLIIFTVLLIIDLFNINLNDNQNKKLVEVVTIEGLDNMNVNELPISINPAVDFCKSNVDSNDMQEKCGKLTETNCNKTSCCVWLNKEKCVPGDQNGPTFKTDKLGNNIEIINFNYRNKCYGKCE